MKFNIFFTFPYENGSHVVSARKEINKSAMSSYMFLWSKLVFYEASVVVLCLVDFTVSVRNEELLK